jgi:hypothetical protein
MSGATSSGSACAATVPVKTVVACLQKTGTEDSMFGYKSIASRIRDGCTNGKKQKAGEKNIKIDYRFFEHFRIDEHQSAAFGFTLDFASEIL